MKRKVFIFLILVTISLVGCNTAVTRENTQTEQSELTENTESNMPDPFSFSVLFNETEENPYSEEWEILDEYKSLKNVSLDIILGNDSDFENAIELNLNSESPPDVILKCWADTVKSYASEGKLVPINEYEHLMPNYRAYIESNNLEDEVDKLRLSNGKYYIVPGYQRDMQVQQWIYRKDVFDAHDIQAPETYEELYDALVYLKGIYPDSTPITASWGGAHLFSMMGAGYGIPAGWSGTQYYDNNQDQWQFAPATDNYREMYRYLNRMYTAGILDDAIFSQSNEDFINKLTDGSAFVTVSWISSGFNNWNVALENNGIVGGEWAPLHVMESTNGIKGLPPVDRFRKGLAISINAVEKPYFEDMIRFLDWAIYSEEGISLTYWGVEGLTYEMTSEGKEFLPNIISSGNPSGTINMKDYGFSSIFDLCEDEAYEDNKKPDDIVAFLDESINANETIDLAPNLVLSVDAIEMIDSFNGNLIDYVNQTSIQFIKGELDIDDDWNAYLSDLENYGYTTLESIWENAWSDQKE